MTAPLSARSSRQSARCWLRSQPPWTALAANDNTVDRLPGLPRMVIRISTSRTSIPIARSELKINAHAHKRRQLTLSYRNPALPCASPQSGHGFGLPQGERLIGLSLLRQFRPDRGVHVSRIFNRSVELRTTCRGCSQLARDDTGYKACLHQRVPPPAYDNSVLRFLHPC